MAGICFFFESEDIDVWSGKDLDAWHYAAAAAGDIDRIHIVNKTNMELKNPDIGRYEFTISKELPSLEGRVTKLVTPWEANKHALSIWEWNHSTDWYVFGPALGWRSEPLDEPEVYVPQAGLGALHSVHVASIVMTNRYWVIG